MMDSQNESQDKGIKNENTVEFRQFPTSQLIIFQNVVYPS